VFRDLPPALCVVRYHSLVVKQIAEPFALSAWDDNDMIHGIRHKTCPLHGGSFIRSPYA